MQQAIHPQTQPGEQTVVPARRPMRRGLVVAAVLLVLLLALLCWVGVFGGNVRTVSPGRVYRSAQISGNNYTADTARWIGFDLDSVVRRYGIKTLINLRGGSQKNDYYRDEVAECDRRGISLIDIPMSAVHLPPPTRLQQLFYVFDHASYPILYHCQGGSDRSGLVGTIYRNLYDHVPLDQAEQEQLTLRYGHLSFGSTYAMDRFFDFYRRTGRGQNLRTWIETTYPAIYEREEGKR